MADATNIWDDVPDWRGAGARRLIRAGGGLCPSIWEFQPGQPEHVYHFHHGSDELLVVLRSEPKLRLGDGERTLREGDTVPLPHGPEGGRVISNPGRLCRAHTHGLGETPTLDVAEYPETGKIGIITDGKTWGVFSAATMRRSTRCRSSPETQTSPAPVFGNVP